jgi:hypothetical protein
MLFSTYLSPSFRHARSHPLPSTPTPVTLLDASMEAIDKKEEILHAILGGAPLTADADNSQARLTFRPFFLNDANVAFVYAVIVVLVHAVGGSRFRDAFTSLHQHHSHDSLAPSLQPAHAPTHTPTHTKASTLTLTLTLLLSRR